MKYYAVNFNIFGVSTAGVVTPQYTRLFEEQYKEFIPECLGRHLLVAFNRNRIVRGDFADDKAFIAYLEELVRERTLCETLGVQFRRVPDSLRKMPTKIKVCRANMKKPDLELEDPVTYEKSCEAYAKYQETRDLWLEYLESVLVK